jgi:hypothetical protein
MLCGEEALFEDVDCVRPETTRGKPKEAEGGKVEIRCYLFDELGRKTQK